MQANNKGVTNMNKVLTEKVSVERLQRAANSFFQPEITFVDGFPPVDIPKEYQINKFIEWCEKNMEEAEARRLQYEIEEKQRELNELKNDI